MIARADSLCCVIVDDSTFFLAAARNLLQQQGISIVGVAATVSEALRRVEELRPDLALVDIDLGGESGFELAERLAGTSVPVVLISTHAQQDFADLIAESPAVGFLAKSDLSSVAILALLDGRDGDRISAIRGT
ncbi:response regulator [Nocardia nova]|uniref:response regulator n=1 Tax=Nocardia nova TaxID=37330 RepID=UPI000CEA5BEB|nr:response regulator transcription factor [Nocardia nova]PPJ11945.1 hypothetical protein C5E51_06300 [Nocardia nova]PPJ16341.1 hypothetical protein C5E44_17990 [Nocardia nova]